MYTIKSILRCFEECELVHICKKEDPGRKPEYDSRLLVSGVWAPVVAHDCLAI